MRLLAIFLIPGLMCAACTPRSGYTYCRTITVQAGQVTGTLTNFTNLICANSTLGNGTACATVTGLNQSGGGAHVQNASGYDIVFDIGAGLLNWESQKYVASTGEVVIHLLNASITVGTVVNMSYGNSGISTFQGGAVGSAWNDGFTYGVWLLPDGITLNVSDSSSAGNNGTNINGVTATSGQIDGGANFVGSSSQDISIGAISQLASASSATYSLWYKRASAGAVIAAGEDGNGAGKRFSILGDSTGNVYLVAESSTTGYGYFVSNDTAWHYVVMVFNGAGVGNSGRLQGYQDGAPVTLSFAGTTIPATLNSAAQVSYIGRAPTSSVYSTGLTDEVELRIGIAESSNWVAARYNNQSAPATFEVFGAETSGGVTCVPTLSLLGVGCS